jgi:hypothetical protein
LEDPEDLTAEDRYAKEEAEEADDGDDDLEWIPHAVNGSQRTRSLAR